MFKIFVGNIDKRITKEEICKVFEVYGKIQDDVRLFNGYCFIIYDNSNSMYKAIENENNQKMGLYNIRVEQAKNNKKRNRYEENKDKYDKYKRNKYEEDKNRRQEKEYKKYTNEDNMMLCHIDIFFNDKDLILYAKKISSELFQNKIKSNIFYIENSTFNKKINSHINKNRYTLFITEEDKDKNLVSFNAHYPNGNNTDILKLSINDIIPFIKKNESDFSEENKKIDLNKLFQYVEKIKK